MTVLQCLEHWLFVWPQWWLMFVQSVDSLWASVWMLYVPVCRIILHHLTIDYWMLYCLCSTAQ